MNTTDDDYGDDDDYDVLAFIIAFIICVQCAKEPEYCCENCNKTYKLEGRYKAHIAVCCVRPDTTIVMSSTDISELLRQNREMMELMRKQQETIELLVSQLIPTTATATAAATVKRI